MIRRKKYHYHKYFTPIIYLRKNHKRMTFQLPIIIFQNKADYIQSFNTVLLNRQQLRIYHIFYYIELSNFGFLYRRERVQGCSLLHLI